MARSVASGQPRPLDELTVNVALSEIKEAALSKEMNSTRDTWGVVLVLVLVVGLVLDRDSSTGLGGFENGCGDGERAKSIFTGGKRRSLSLDRSVEMPHLMSVKILVRSQIEFLPLLAFSQE